MNWVSVFIQRHVFTWMIMVSLILFGWIAFHRMGISEFPDVDFPVVDVGVSWDGATPELSEKQLADPIENALSSIQGITKLYSVSRANGVSVTAEFELGTNIDTAVQDIQVALARIQRQLPREADPPIVRKTNPEDRPILWVSVASDTLSRADLMAYVKDYIRPRFSTIPGVAAIQLGGYVEPAMMIWANPRVLQSYQLTLGDLIGSVQAEHLELPAGQLETPRQDIQVRLMGEANTPEALAALPLSRRGGSLNFRPIPLGAVATVAPGLSNERTIARSMGKVAVGLGFNKQRGSNAVAVGDAIKARLASLSTDTKQPLDIGITYDATTFVKDAIHELLMTLVLSGLLTTLVCWLFLGTWNATLNVALAIPTALFGAFIVMHALGFTLNTFTLLGLSMAIGVVVDDAIMVLENITRHQAMGKSSLVAAQEGIQEIMVATVAASSVLLSLFLPVVLVSGILGTYLIQFGLTVCAAVALSLVEAVTITPMRLARFQARGTVGWLPVRVQSAVGRLTGVYRRLLEWMVIPARF
ncbi:efflux RND transporter permease subunit, partial [bacterium]|nr:efflux RND transporter permease subunit [bacterium]